MVLCYNLNGEIKHKIMQIVLGLIGIAVSIAIIVYRVQIKHFIGGIAWAEAHLGQGGTYTLLLLIGLFGFVFSLMYMTGTTDVLFGNFAERFFGAPAR